MKDDYISRQAVLDKIKEVCLSREQEWIDFRVSYGFSGQRDYILKFVESLPCVEPTRPCGRWITKNFHAVKCSKCGFDFDIMKCSFIDNMYFCPNCGAEMELYDKG